ncbi:MAG: membrane protein insertase YidC [Candidatus Eisenbacteria bacterium]|nr:membrane protein insertase YidC [Candidatus Eisenbacteria bacterium]
MEDRRLIVAIALAIAILLGWQLMLSRTGLDKQIAPPPPDKTATAPGTPAGGPTGSPAAGGASKAGAPATPTPAATMSSPTASAQAALVDAPPESLISVNTELWTAVFSSRGARPVHWVLKGHRRGDHKPLELIPEGAGLERFALRRSGAETDFSQAYFRVIEDRTDDTSRVLAFQAQESSGASITVRYHIPGKSFVTSVECEISDARPDDRLVVQWRGWKLDTETNQPEDLRAARVSVLMGEQREEDDLGKFKKSSEKAHSGAVQWVVLRSKYFATGFLFPQDAVGGVAALGSSDSMRLGVRYEYPLLGRKSVVYGMYVGPVDFWKLQTAGHNLTRLVDSGFKPMVPLNRAMLKFFTFTHKFVPNYGLVIIVLSVLMRLAFWPLNHSQMQSMKKMQELQPVLEKLREKYKGDQERLNKETFALYKEQGVNPLGGCLPILFQMPIFFALYSVLSGSIELRQAGFVGWISDLSAPDVLMTYAGFPVHVLPLVMSATMIWQQKLTPMDPRQAITGYLMPVVMLFIFYGMPSGLVLYWTVTNILTVLQQMQMRAGTKPAETVAS